MLKCLLILTGAVIAASSVIAAAAMLDSAISEPLARWLSSLGTEPQRTICGYEIASDAESLGFDASSWHDTDCSALSDADRCVLHCYSKGVTVNIGGGCYDLCL